MSKPDFHKGMSTIGHAMAAAISADVTRQAQQARHAFKTSSSVVPDGSEETLQLD